MGRLKGRGLPGRLGKAPSRLRTKVDAKGQSQKSNDQNWYKTSRWQKLRAHVLRRDGYVCQATGVLLVGRYPAGNSPAVDHIKPHRWNPDLFWDETNLRAVSKEWHDREKQSLERRGLA